MQLSITCQLAKKKWSQHLTFLWEINEMLYLWKLLMCSNTGRPCLLLLLFFFFRIAGGKGKEEREEEARADHCRVLQRQSRPQWECHVISKKSTRVDPQLGCRRTESRHVATPSRWELQRRRRTQPARESSVDFSPLNVSWQRGDFPPTQSPSLQKPLLFLALILVYIHGLTLTPRSPAFWFFDEKYHAVSAERAHNPSPLCQRAAAQWEHCRFNFHKRLSCLLHRWNFLGVLKLKSHGYASLCLKHWLEQRCSEASAAKNLISTMWE